MAHTDQLVIPEAARKDTRSFELLRVWIANQEQHVSLRSGAWSDPAHWGVMLADLAGHIANALEQTQNRDRAASLERIQQAFNAELDAPTGEASGELL